MRVVLDTNVLISGVFFSGLPGRILAAWADGGFELVASVEVLAEYRRVAERLHNRFSTIDIDPILDLVTRETRIVEPAFVPVSACDDPDDLKFLACALAGGGPAPWRQLWSGHRARRPVRVLVPAGSSKRVTSLPPAT